MISWSRYISKNFSFHSSIFLIRFLTLLREYFFCWMLSELRFVKWVVFLKRNCIAKWVVLIASFSWLWNSTRKSKSNGKTTPNKRFWIICFLIQISFFGAVLERFSHCNFNFFSIFTRNDHKNASYCSDSQLYLSKVYSEHFFYFYIIFFTKS